MNKAHIQHLMNDIYCRIYRMLTYGIGTLMPSEIISLVQLREKVVALKEKLDLNDL